MTSEVIDRPRAAPQTARMTSITTDLTQLVDTHLVAYGEPDPDRRAELIAAVWTPDGRLVDPPMSGEGHAGIAALAEALQGQFPGHRFRRTTQIDAHHDVLRYGWALVGPDGRVAVAGEDVAQLAADGRLRQICGFFGDPGAVEA
jgi:hypothetical protein